MVLERDDYSDEVDDTYSFLEEEEGLVFTLEQIVSLKQHAQKVLSQYPIHLSVISSCLENKLGQLLNDDPTINALKIIHELVSFVTGNRLLSKDFRMEQIAILCSQRYDELDKSIQERQQRGATVKVHEAAAILRNLEDLINKRSQVKLVKQYLANSIEVISRKESVLVKVLEILAQSQKYSRINRRTLLIFRERKLGKLYES